MAAECCRHHDGFAGSGSRLWLGFNAHQCLHRLTSSIKIAERKNESECGISGPFISRHVCRRDHIGGFYFALCCLVLERGVHLCFFEAVTTCDQAHILKI